MVFDNKSKACCLRQSNPPAAVYVTRSKYWKEKYNNNGTKILGRLFLNRQLLEDLSLQIMKHLNNLIVFCVVEMLTAPSPSINCFLKLP